MKVQRAAAKALGDRKGAVVALDPRTGAILAMVSYPRYDPNKLDAQWTNLIADPDSPLVNRAIQGLYPPGSVFKIIVASAGLQTGTVTTDTKFSDTGSVKLGGYEINNYGNKVYGDHDFAQAFASSINTTFAKLGVKLGADTFAGYVDAIRVRQVASPGGSEEPRASSPTPAAWIRPTWRRPPSVRERYSPLRFSWPSRRLLWPTKARS